MLSSVAEDPACWAEEFSVMFARVAPVFASAPVRKRARSYLLGLLSQQERKNGWTIAELAGEQSPDGMQRLLNRCTWDDAQARAGLREYVVAQAGDPGAVVIADETGFAKKGRRSAGVQRQYSGTLGRVENCQIGVHLAYAVPGTGFRALIDAELYVPRSWTGDRDRCEDAGIPDDRTFATKPELARQMLARVIAACVPFAWFTADEAYGQNPGLREWLETEKVKYVLVVPCSQLIETAAGKRRADELAALVPHEAWQRLSCGDGSKGPRMFDWALVATAGPQRHLMIRRSLHPGETGKIEIAYYLCWAPRPVTLAELARVAGARWGVEDCFGETKNETGLDHYQARLYIAWYRHITLAMLAHAFLAVTAARARPPSPRQSGETLGQEPSGGHQPAREGTRPRHTL